MNKHSFSDPFTWNSTPVINFVNGMEGNERNTFLDTLLKNSMAMHHAPGPKNCVTFMKEKLGRQKLTWMGSCKQWVWEDENWRVFVNDDQGIAFEVRETLDHEQVLIAYDDFLTKIGVK